MITTTCTTYNNITTTNNNNNNKKIIIESCKEALKYCNNSNIMFKFYLKYTNHHININPGLLMTSGVFCIVGTIPYDLL
jgi:hypothetical protein